MGSDGPFLLPPRSVLSVSGGRTSMYMLWRVLQANGGSLPPDVVPIFCNTGKEREETLRFVRECSERWGVPIRWLEYRHETATPGSPGVTTETVESRPAWEPDDDDELQEVGREELVVRRVTGRTPAKGRHHFVEVTFETASRKGEPLLHAIRARNFLPNPVARFCTVECKIRTSNRFVRQSLGWEKYTNAVGLRADEPQRVSRLVNRKIVTVEETLFGPVRHVQRNGGASTGETVVCPLASAGVENEDVLKFWASQPFDLELPADPKTGRTLAGNCTLCFLKSAATILSLIREDPESADWWIEAETLMVTGSGTSPFRSDRPPYAELKRIALGMADGPGWLWSDRGGMACGSIDQSAECNCTD